VFPGSSVFRVPAQISKFEKMQDALARNAGQDAGVTSPVFELYGSSFRRAQKNITKPERKYVP